MPTEYKVKFKKKQFDATTDSTNGVLVFDNLTHKIYVGGECFSSNVSNATFDSTTQTLTITKCDNTTISLSFGGYENSVNKVTSLSQASTDTQYPSAKCVYDLVGQIDTALNTILNGTGQ